jgi:hypothetical protein
MRTIRFTATVTPGGRDRALVTVPFASDDAWGAKPRHHVTGTVAGVRYRGVVQALDDGHALVLPPAWLRDHRLSDGDTVEVELAPEGPQRPDLPPDLAAALDANPAAAQFFDSLAQFYRKGYLSWIDATRRNPAQRPERIAVVVQLLAEGKKTRPR